MKYIYWSLLAFLLPLKAQECGVESSWFWNQVGDFHEQTHLDLRTDQNIRYIPFTVHWVKNTDGTPGNNASLDPLYYSIAQTNKILSRINIQLYIDGNINVINNTNYLSVTRGSAEHQALLALANPNTANIWVVDGWQGSPSSGWGGPTSGIELSDITLGTFPHECGHFLGLAHTFDTGNGIELINRAGNCSAAGDRICDTDADPYGLTTSQITGDSLAHSHCNMTSNTRDANGDLYTPPFNNIMSYYGGSCGFTFTPGQYLVMNDAYDQWHNNYQAANTFSLAEKPTNLQFSENGNSAKITWTEAMNTPITVFEISADNGGTWVSLGGPVGSAKEIYLNDLDPGFYKVRARYLNSLNYSDILSIQITNDLVDIPVVFKRDTASLGSIAQFEIASVGLNQSNNLNNNYSIYDFSSGHDFIAGGTYDFRIKTKSNGSGAIPTYYGIWADLNQDGDFEDAGELLYSPQNTTFEWTVNGQFTLPANTQIGPIRLRLRCFSQAREMSATGIFSGSEIEDYIINVIPDEAPSDLMALYDPIQQKVSLTWKDVSDAFAYTIERSEDGIHFSAIHTTNDGSTKSYNDANILGNKQYAYRVKRSIGAKYTNEKNVNTQYLTPNYCTPQNDNGCAIGYEINAFSLSSDGTNQIFSKNSAGNCGTTGPGFSDFSATDTISLNAQSLYFWTIINQNNPNGFEHMKIYLDTNQNGVFEVNELLFQADGVQTNSGSINIPNATLNGYTRMRVRAYFNTIDGPCGNSSYGETEDYAVLISNGKVSPVYNAHITNVTADQIDLQWERNHEQDQTGDAITGYQLDYSTDGSTWNALATLDTNVYSYSHTGLNSGTTYLYRITVKAFKSSTPITIWATTQGSSSGIANNESSIDLKIYPNPASDWLHFESSESISEIIWFDLQGKIIQSDQYDKKEFQTPVYNYPKGMYFLKVVFNNGHYEIRKVSLK